MPYQDNFKVSYKSVLNFGTPILNQCPNLKKWNEIQRISKQNQRRQISNHSLSYIWLLVFLWALKFITSIVLESHDIWLKKVPTVYFYKIIFKVLRKSNNPWNSKKHKTCSFLRSVSFESLIKEDSYFPDQQWKQISENYFL